MLGIDTPDSWKLQGKTRLPMVEDLTVLNPHMTNTFPTISYKYSSFVALVLYTKRNPDTNDGSALSGRFKYILE